MTLQDPGAASQTTPLDPQQTPQLPSQPVEGRNVLALVALIVSIVGFIAACIPGVFVLGWILLPIAFILSIVSLFMKGSGKGLGIAGLIVSIVGTIVAFIVFFAVVAVAVNGAFSDETTVTEDTSAVEGATEEPPSSSSEAGTRDNPVAIGSTISSDNWSVVVNSYTADGTAAVASANSFNEAPAAGSHYEIVNYTVTFTGEDSSYAAEVGVDIVTSAGNVINSFDNLVILSDGFGLDELFAGASATGSAAFLVPDGESVLIRVKPGILADEVFVSP